MLVDTNFINFSIKNKLEIVSAMMDCLLAKCTIDAIDSLLDGTTTGSLIMLACFLVTGIPCITDCVMAELERLGHKYRVALR